MLLLLVAASHRHRTMTATVCGLYTVLSSACVYDSQARCGPGQVYNDEFTECLCGPGLVLTGTTCVPCGEHEIAGTNGCVCETGYARAGATSPCTLKPAALGSTCNTTTTPCTDLVYSYCAPAGTDGYCTKSGCTSSAECDGYACDTTASPAYCRRPPVGAGQACTSAADCAGTEATYCDSYMAHACLVEGCTVSLNDCYEGTDCCDLSQFGVPKPVCVAKGGCPQ